MSTKVKLCKVYTLLILFSGINYYSQQGASSVPIDNSNKPVCETKLLTNYKKWRENVVPVQNLVTTLKHDTCLNKKFSIVFYLIQDSTYNINPGTLPAITASLLTPAINTLNNVFRRICVSFENCSTVVIPNYPYNNWSQNPLEPIVTANWYTTQTINFFIVDNPGGGPNSGGYTYMPGTPGRSDIIVMRRTAVNTTTLLHLFGHFFGLPDTYGEIGSPVIPGPVPPATTYEYFARTNCYTNGDGFCDTEADPYPAGYNDSNAPVPPCFFDYGPADGLSRYYTPPVDNYMSEYRGTCRCRFTQEQYNFMARVILTQRLYLH